MKHLFIALWLTLLAIMLAVLSCAPQKAAAPAEKPAAPAVIDKEPAVTRQAWEDKWEKTLAAARQEGKVSVVTFIGGETRDALIKGFKSKYGIDIEFIIGTGNENFVKLQAQRKAGLYTADASINGGSTLVMFKRESWLDILDPHLILPEVADSKNWFNNEMPYFDKERTGIGFLNQYNSCVLINTELVREGEITSYYDLLKPQWKDKVILYDPTISGSGSMFFAMLSIGVWNTDEASKWLRQMLREQNLTLTRDPRLQVEWVARGKFPVGLAVYTDQLVNFAALGTPIAQQKVKEGGFVTASTGGLSLFNRPAHPSAAVVFANWLLSREGQVAFTSGFGGPSRRKDVKTEGPYAILTPSAGDKFYVEDEERMLKKVDLMKVAAQVIAEARR